MRSAATAKTAEAAKVKDEKAGATLAFFVLAHFERHLAGLTVRTGKTSGTRGPASLRLLLSWNYSTAKGVTS